MSSCTLVTLLLAAPLLAAQAAVIGTTVGNQIIKGTGGVISTRAREDLSTISTTETQQSTSFGNQEEPKTGEHCAWWCNELYATIVVAAGGAALLIAIILCIVSCCLCRRRSYKGNSEVKDTELTTLYPQTIPDFSQESPSVVEAEPKAGAGISDVENCTSVSEHPASETPQHSADQPNEAPGSLHPPDSEITPC